MLETVLYYLNRFKDSCYYLIYPKQHKEMQYVPYVALNDFSKDSIRESRDHKDATNLQYFKDTLPSYDMKISTY